MQKVRPKGKLIEAAMAAASEPCTMKGGVGYQVRRYQALLLECGLTLGGWGRPAESRKAQPADLFAPKRDDAGLPL